MVQATTFGLPTSGPMPASQFGTQGDESLDALLSMHSGATAPTYAVKGTLWLDTSANPHVLKLYDGASWITLAAVNTTTHVATVDAGIVPATLAADKAFRRGNVLGAVSQTAGVPTGALIESGVNSDGRWTRFADGTQICYHSMASGSALNTAVGSLFRTASNTWTFPQAFAQAPAISGIQAGSPGYAWLSEGGGTPTATTCTWAMFAAGTSASIPTAVLMAIGRWF